MDPVKRKRDFKWIKTVRENSTAEKTWCNISKRLLRRKVRTVPFFRLYLESSGQILWKIWYVWQNTFSFVSSFAWIRRILARWKRFPYDAEEGSGWPGGRSVAIRRLGGQSQQTPWAATGGPAPGWTRRRPHGLGPSLAPVKQSSGLEHIFSFRSGCGLLDYDKSITAGLRIRNYFFRILILPGGHYGSGSNGVSNFGSGSVIWDIKSNLLCRKWFFWLLHFSSKRPDPQW